MKTKLVIVTILYSLVLFGFLLYSYCLIDPNITLINHPLWSRFLESVLQIGYYQRSFSWQIYLCLVGLLTLFHLYFKRNCKKYNPIIVAGLIAIILVLSYPFLSHDFLKYMFDAKILTQYHQNPYMMRPIDFSYDPWLRFLHWVEQPFRYGPVFLSIIMIPSFIAIGKFLLNFILFKFVFMVFYISAVFILQKMKHRWAIIFATHPLIIIEGLINGHNDIIGVTLFILGIYYLYKKEVIARLFLILSSGIKYLTLPTLFLLKKDNFNSNKLIFLVLLILPYLLLHSFFGNLFNAEIQTWYFIILIGFLPIYENIINKLLILFIGLLLSYYPFIYLGKWEQFNGISIKHIIILSFTIINILCFLIIPKWRKELKLFFSMKAIVKI